MELNVWFSGSKVCKHTDEFLTYLPALQLCGLINGYGFSEMRISFPKKFKSELTITMQFKFGKCKH